MKWFIIPLQVTILTVLNLCLLSNAAFANQSYQVEVVIKPQHEVVLSSQMDGYIEKLPYREGDYFTKGALLVGFACGIHQARYQKAKIALSMFKKRYDAMRRLLSLGSASGDELETTKAEYGEAKAEVNIQHSLVDYCHVLAPFSGEVVKLYINQYQTTSQHQPLLEILDNKNLRLEMIVPSTWLMWLKPHLAFTITVTETGKTYPAEVTKLLAKVDAVSRTIRVFGVIKGAHKDLVAGMSAKAFFNPKFKAQTKVE